MMIQLQMKIKTKKIKSISRTKKIKRKLKKEGKLIILDNKLYDYEIDKLYKLNNNINEPGVYKM